MNLHFKKVDRRFDDKFNKCGWADAKCTHFYLGNDHDSANSNDIKDFIHSQIKLSLEEMIKEVLPEKIEHRKPHIKESKVEFNKNRGFNQCLSEIQANLTKYIKNSNGQG